MRTFTRDVSLRALAVSLLAFLPAVGLVSPASAARLENKVAVFSGIDKITGRITSFDVYINETVQFGALQVTPKVCYSRDDTEAQKIDSFVEVDEITLDRKIRRIFTGWMFADSPGLTPSSTRSTTSGSPAASRTPTFRRHPQQVSKRP